MRWLLLFVACSDPAPKCPGAAPATVLHEAYCQNGEAARCFFLQLPVDGF